MAQSDGTKPPPETSAMRKLLREPFPFSTRRHVLSPINRREVAVKQSDPEIRARLLAQADREEKEMLAGEVWPLTVREIWEIQGALLEATRVAEDMEASVRQPFIRLVIPRVYAHAVLRVPGTAGKVRVLTAEEAAQIDPNAADAVYGAYVQAFELTGDELPKAEAPPS